ncbi:MAG: 5-methylcytosine restriction system specificity protein McrC, partial [Promethearchaeota archaeon]
TFPRGRILIKETIINQIKRQIGIICELNLLDKNNPYNQVIKFTLNRIKPLISIDEKTLSRRNYLLYKKLSNILDEIEPGSWNSHQIEKLDYNRLNNAYKPIHDFCRLILDDFSIKFEKGTDSFFAFVINSWNIYEVFLREVFKEFLGSKYRVKSYKIDNNLSDEVNWDEKLQPDLILIPISSTNEKETLFIDAKYKKKYNISDFRQMNHYLTDYYHNIYLKAGALIYPRYNEDSVSTIEGNNQKVVVHYIDLEKIRDKTYLEDFIYDVVDSIIKAKDQ